MARTTILLARARRWVAPVALAAFGGAATAPAAAAQTLFEWAPQDSTYSRYLRPEACFAAMTRVTEVSEWQARVDTLGREASAALPAEAVEVARRCGARFTVDDLPESSEATAVDIFLATGRLDDARTVVERRLAQAEKEGVGEHASALVAFVNAYVSAPPAQLEAARELAARIDAYGSRVRRERVNAHFAIYRHARSVMDLALLVPAAAAFTEAAEGLTDEEWMTPMIQESLADAVFSMTLPVLRDSSPEAYLATLERRMQETLGDSYGTHGAGTVGKKAPPLVGDFWFGRGDSAEARPRPGRTSMVVKVDHRCLSGCMEAFSVIKRLHERYGPDLEITLVGRTAGYYNLRPPLEPAEEAEAMREFYLGEIGLPAALTVSTTPFVMRPAPDGRRVDKPVQNDTTYGFPPNPSSNAFAIVDESGTVIYYSGGLGARKERELVMLLDFLIERKRVREGRDGVGTE